MLLLDLTISGQALLWTVVGFGLITLLLIGGLKKYFHSRGGQELAGKSGMVKLSDRNKYESVNVFRLRGTFLQYGLMLALGMAVLGFAWTEYDGRDTSYQVDMGDFMDLEVIPPATTTPPQPPPPQPPPVITEVPDDEVIEDEEPEFVDMSITEDESLVVPEPVKEELPPAPLPMPKEKEPEQPDFFTIVESMPLFPGCDDLPTKEERKTCSDKNLLSFLSKNMKYPAVARENGIEGTAFVSFIVETDGTITGAKVLRAPGGGLGEEALRVVNLMNEEGLRWTPGKQRTEPVRVQFNLPVRFKLQ
ncbi:MAG: TonB family protein [Saprospiraceae bacterium]